MQARNNYGCWRVYEIIDPSKHLMKAKQIHLQYDNKISHFGIVELEFASLFYISIQFCVINPDCILVYMYTGVSYRKSNGSTSS